MTARDGLAAAILAGIVLVLSMPLIASGRDGTSEAADQNVWHLPVIRIMAEQWPHLDLVNYESATAPGYHVVLAAAHRLGVRDRPGLQVINAVLSCALPLVVFAGARAFVRTRTAMLLACPLACSPFVLSGAIWVTTDNVSLAFAALAVGVAMIRPMTGAVAVIVGVSAAVAVAIRQIHVWPGAAALMGGLLGSPLGRGAPGAWRSALDQPPRWRRLGWSLLAIALPALVVALLVSIWGGLTPPYFRTFHDRGVNPATPAVALALCGAFMVVLAPGPLLRGLGGVGRDRWLTAAALGGAAAALLVPTGYDMDAGRWGGPLWHLVRATPELGQRSLLLIPLAAGGGVAVVVLMRRAVDAGRGREAIVLGAAVVAFVVVQSANSQCFQRYLEPPMLLAMAWWIAMGAPPAEPGADPGAGGRRVPVAGAVTLSFMQLGLSAWMVYGQALTGRG